MWLLLLLACNRCAPPTAVPDGAPRPSTEVAPVVRATAPTTEVYGLRIGRSDEAEILAWLAERSLTCPGAPSVRRTTVRYACAPPLATTLLPDRAVKGEIHEILLVRGDDTPLRHFSTLRRYSLPPDAIADYTAAISALKEVLGEPARVSEVPEGADLGGTMAHYATAWLYTDLEVRLTLLKANGPYISVSETWDQPGAEKDDRVRARPGANPHQPGANPHEPGANPHG